MSRLLILSASASEPDSLRLARIADCFGINAVVIPVGAGQIQETLRGAASKGGNLAISLSLKMVRDLAVGSSRGLEHVFARFPQFKAWFIRAADGTDALKPNSRATGGFPLAFEAPRPIQQIHAPIEARPFCGPLTGFSWTPAEGSRGGVFHIHPAPPHYTPLLTTPEGTLCGLLRCSSSLVVISGFDRIPDLDEQISTDYDFLPRLHEWLPVIVFLRAAFGSQLWHNPFRSACFVIDDPMLVKKYGFLDFGKVLQALKRCQGHLSLAYIPYNHSRVDPDTSRLFRDHAPWLSLCVHGNDHTCGEFAERDGQALLLKAKSALARMDRLKARERLNYDPVMVFPQGMFSRDAMESLKRAGYWATVNFGAIAFDGPPQTLSVRDYLLPAVTTYASFPLFNRRYPETLLEFAVDGFLEKPILFMEHHGYFKDGGRDLVEKIESVNGWGWRDHWHSLGTIVQHTAWERTTASGRREMRLFSPRRIVQNTGDVPIHHSFVYPESNPDLVVGISSNDLPQDFVRQKRAVRFELCLPPRSVSTLRVAFQPVEGQGKNSMPRAGLGVWARRRLSEFRDQHLAPHPRLLNGSMGLIRLLRKARSIPTKPQRA